MQLYNAKLTLCVGTMSGVRSNSSCCTNNKIGTGICKEKLTNTVGVASCRSPGSLHQFVFKEVVIDFVQRELPRFVHSYTIVKHERSQLNAVNQNDLAVPVARRCLFCSV